MEKELLKDRFAGVLVGLGAGDALGGPVEGLRRKDVAKVHGKKVARRGVTVFLRYSYVGPRGNIDWERAHPFLWRLQRRSTTDDTQQAVHFGKAILKHGELTLDVAKEALLSWRDENDQDPRWPGPSSIAGTDQLRKRMHPSKTGSKKSKSCGSAMRAPVIALAFHDNLTKLRRAALNASIPTHNSPVTRAGAVITAEVVARVLRGQGVESAVKSAVNPFRKAKDVEVKKLVRNIGLAISKKSMGHEKMKKLIAGHLDMSQALPVALWAAMKHENDFEKAVQAAASYFAEDHHAGPEMAHSDYKGSTKCVDFGDTDTYASIAGAIVGARVGLAGIPTKFRGVDKEKELIRIAHRLSERT